MISALLLPLYTSYFTMQQEYRAVQMNYPQCSKRPGALHLYVITTIFVEQFRRIRINSFAILASLILFLLFLVIFTSQILLLALLASSSCGLILTYHCTGSHVCHLQKDYFCWWVAPWAGSRTLQSLFCFPLTLRPRCGWSHHPSHSHDLPYP